MARPRLSIIKNTVLKPASGFNVNSLVTSGGDTWRGDSGITIETGVKYWDGRANAYRFDKLATGEQPVQAADSNFNNHQTLQFTPTDGMDVSSFIGNTTDQVTMAFPMRCDSTATAILVEWSPTTLTNVGFQFLIVGTNSIRARIDNSAGTSISANYTAASNFGATIWVMTYDGTSGGTVNLYEGNTLRATASNATGGISNLSGALNRLFIGQAANDAFHGQIQMPELFFDRRVITSAEQASLVSHWNERYGLSVA